MRIDRDALMTWAAIEAAGRLPVRRVSCRVVSPVVCRSTVTHRRLEVELFIHSSVNVRPPDVRTYSRPDASHRANPSTVLATGQTTYMDPSPSSSPTLSSSVSDLHSSPTHASVSTVALRTLQSRHTLAHAPTYLDRHHRARSTNRSAHRHTHSRIIDRYTVYSSRLHETRAPPTTSHPVGPPASVLLSSSPASPLLLSDISTATGVSASKV